MARVLSGRYTARPEGDYVVFLIGMTINRPLRVHEWGPVFVAMPRMLRELDAHPELGLLAWRFALMGSGPTVVQYWRSFEQLEAYASKPDATHLPAWRRFNRRARESGSVGVWHETFRVSAGQSEAIYVDTPRLGLGAFVDPMPLGSTSRAATRLNGQAGRDY
jgi:Domain of unknown function (DUF4188)